VLRAATAHMPRQVIARGMAGATILMKSFDGVLSIPESLQLCLVFSLVQGAQPFTDNLSVNVIAAMLSTAIARTGLLRAWNMEMHHHTLPATSIVISAGACCAVTTK
jgi:hypothetical protein